MLDHDDQVERVRIIELPSVEAVRLKPQHTNMISTTSTKVSTITVSGVQDERMKIDGTDPKYGDWRDDLARDGYAVVKGAVPQEQALKYADKMYTWLEGLYV